MLCQRCQQRQATVFFSQTVGNQTTQAHLCEVCAQEQSQAYGGINPMNFNPFAALTDFLNNFMTWDEGAIAEVNSGRTKPASVDLQAQCPHCGYQLSFFKQNGRLGCTQCYQSFKAALDPLISQIHGNVKHVEESFKVGTFESVDSKLEKVSGDPAVQSLRERLKMAIQEEKFEDAVTLRDQIKSLENP